MPDTRMLTGGIQKLSPHPTEFCKRLMGPKHNGSCRGGSVATERAWGFAPGRNWGPEPPGGRVPNSPASPVAVHLLEDEPPPGVECGSEASREQLPEVLADSRTGGLLKGVCDVVVRSHRDGRWRCGAGRSWQGLAWAGRSLPRRRRRGKGGSPSCRGQCSTPRSATSRP